MFFYISIMLISIPRFSFGENLSIYCAYYPAFSINLFKFFSFFACLAINSAFCRYSFILDTDIRISLPQLKRLKANKYTLQYVLCYNRMFMMTETLRI